MMSVNPSPTRNVQPPTQISEPIQDDDAPLDLSMNSKKRQSKPEPVKTPTEKKPTTPTKEQNQPLNLKRLTGGKIFATATVSFKGPAKKNIKSPMKTPPTTSINPGTSSNSARIAPVQFPTQSKSPVEQKYDQSRPPPIPPRNPINRVRKRSIDMSPEEYKNIPRIWQSLV